MDLITVKRGKTHQLAYHSTGGGKVYSGCRRSLIAKNATESTGEPEAVTCHWCRRKTGGGDNGQRTALGL